MVQLEPGNLHALELRAKAYYHLGEYDMAQTHYREALKFDPEHKVQKHHIFLFYVCMFVCICI